MKFSLLSTLFGSSLISLSSSCRTENKVLFYGPAYDADYAGRCASLYNTYVTSTLSYTADVVSAATWSTMTTAQFEKYNAIVFCDPTCSTDNTILNTAAANANEWGAAIDGNILVIGTDEAYHYTQGGLQLIQNGLDYVTDDTCDSTGLYMSLSCYYDGKSLTVDALSYFGTFSTTPPTGCFNDAHIVATHPVLTGITDASLSGWSCSVHETLSTYPSSFEPLAIALNEGIGGSGMSFGDGSFGIPYIVANNVVVVGPVCDIPECDNNPCEEAEDMHCRIHHSNGCDECEYGYWKLDYNHPCISCNDYFGDGCMFCQDFNGCGQCQDGCTRVYNEDCDVWECDCESGGMEPLPQECSYISSCSSSPCECNESDLHCKVCHVNGCDQCEDGYFKKSYSTKCEHCQAIFGSHCQFCQDFDGCGQCDSQCNRVYNNDCKLWECECPM